MFCTCRAAAPPAVPRGRSVRVRRRCLAHGPACMQACNGHLHCLGLQSVHPQWSLQDRKHHIRAAFLELAHPAPACPCSLPADGDSLPPPPPLAPLEPCRVLNTTTDKSTPALSIITPGLLTGVRLRWGAQSSYLTSAFFDLGSSANEVECTVAALLFQLPASPDVPPPGTAPIFTSPPVSVRCSNHSQRQPSRAAAWLWCLLCLRLPACCLHDPL
jgi:hypothetical protein